MVLLTIYIKFLFISIVLQMFDIKTLNFIESKVCICICICMCMLHPVSASMPWWSLCPTWDRVIKIKEQCII